DAVAIPEGLDAHDLLTRGDLAADDPIERAAGEDLVDPLRSHARDMDMQLRQALLLGREHALRDPFLQLFDRLAADGQLDQMQRHDAVRPALFIVRSRDRKSTRLNSSHT